MCCNNVDTEFMKNIKDDCECEICGDTLVDNAFLGDDEIGICDSCADKLINKEMGIVENAEDDSVYCTGIDCIRRLNFGCIGCPFIDDF